MLVQEWAAIPVRTIRNLIRSKLSLIVTGHTHGIKSKTVNNNNNNNNNKFGKHALQRGVSSSSLT
jgi:hypothetical protein